MKKVTPAAQPAKKSALAQTVDDYLAEVTRAHAAELKDYRLGKASIRFAANKPLPAALVTKLVKARIAENESRRSYRDRQ